MSISEDLVADFKMELEGSRKMLAAVPGDKLAWKPHEKSMSLGQLAGHVAEAPAWVQAMIEDEFDMENAGGGDYKPYVPDSLDDLLETFATNAANFEKTVSGLDDDSLRANWTMRKGGNVIMSLPRQTAIRSTIVHHVIHHRGQLSVYLRLLDVSVWAITRPR